MSRGGQPGEHHRTLGRRDVVLGPVPGDRRGCRVEERPAGRRDPVPGLADAARVEQRAPLVEGDPVAVGGLAADHARVHRPERRRQVGVAEQAPGGREGGEVLGGAAFVEQVLPGGVARAAVDERERVLDEAFRERPQPVARRVGDPVAGPLDGRPRVAVEQLRTQLPDGHLVVIAQDTGRADAREPLHDRIGLGAVADDVTEDADAIDRADRREHRVERHEIGVDVREDGQAHRRTA